MGGGVRLKAWLIGPRPIGWRHSGLQNTWNFGAGDVEGSAANGLFLQREMGGSLQRRGKRLAFEDMFAFTRVSRVSVCVREREPHAWFIQAPAAGNMPPVRARHPRWLLLKHRLASAEVSGGDLTIDSLRVSVQYGAHSFPSSSPTLFFVSRLSLNSFQGKKRPRVDFSRRLQGAHEARLIIKRLLWRRRFHRLCCHTHTHAPKKNQIKFLYHINLPPRLHVVPVHL